VTTPEEEKEQADSKPSSDADSLTNILPTWPMTHVLKQVVQGKHACLHRGVTELHPATASRAPASNWSRSEGRSVRANNQTLEERVWLEPANLLQQPEVLNQAENGSTMIPPANKRPQANPRHGLLCGQLLSVPNEKAGLAFSNDHDCSL
jgi:hypothetical protein